MISTVAVIAEHAEVRADGKLDVNGVYNCRYATELPARFAVTLALRFDVEPLDYGVHQRIAVHIMDEDSAEMVNVRATPISFESPRTPGLPAASAPERSNPIDRILDAYLTANKLPIPPPACRKCRRSTGAMTRSQFPSYWRAKTSRTRKSIRASRLNTW